MSKAKSIAFAILILGILITALLVIVLPSVFRASLSNYYMKRLDAWANDGGKIEEIQNQVIGNCGKLVLSQAGAIERVLLMTIDRDDYDFRTDVCMKMTVNRIHKQPEFDKPNIVKMICDDDNPRYELFRRLCRRNGLR